MLSPSWSGDMHIYEHADQANILRGRRCSVVQSLFGCEGPAWEGPPAPDVGEVQVASNSEREARLVRVVEQLRRRLDQLRGENEQLEEELRSADSKLTGDPPTEHHP